jgi:hypothetical protein
MKIAITGGTGGGRSLPEPGRFGLRDLRCCWE